MEWQTVCKQCSQCVIEMVFDFVFVWLCHSHMVIRAIDYRNKTGIPHDLGTAVNIQMMVFGNMGNTSATGMCVYVRTSVCALDLNLFASWYRRGLHPQSIHRREADLR